MGEPAVPAHTDDAVVDRHEMVLADYVAIVKCRWRWVLGSVAVLATLATAYTITSDLRYEATAAVLVRPSTAEGVVRGANTNTGLLSRELTNEIKYATSDLVAQAVAAELGASPEVTVSGDKDADVLQFTAVAGLPEHAAHIANTWAAAYVAQKQADSLASVEAATRQLDQRLEDLRAERDVLTAPVNEVRDALAVARDDQDRAVLQNRLERATSDAAAGLAVITAQEQAVASAIAELRLQGELDRTSTVRIVSNAQAPLEPANAPLSRNLALAAFLGLVLGAGAALLRDNLDNAIKTADDVVRAVGLPVLAAVPKPTRQASKSELGLATLTDPTSILADAYHKLRTSVQFSMMDRDIDSILVTSPNQGEGKTVTSTNLAWALATVTPRVLLADGDFRRPRVHAVYGVENAMGFSDHIVSAQPVGDLALTVELGDTSLAVLPTGPLPPNPAEFVSSRTFATALDAVSEQTDLLVIDGPPVLPVSDALTLARLASAVVLVARAGATTVEQLRAAHHSLRQVGADVLGVVLVGVDSASRYGRYGYYGADSTTERRRASAVPRITVPAAPLPGAGPTPGRSAERRDRRRRGALVES